MARMIPPYIAPENPSPGEHLIFTRFKCDPETLDWVVFHSLGVARHKSRLSGEIDFVVVIPGLGILCLEVKAGRVAREAGEWVFGSGASRRRSAIGPFQQAAEGMHSLQRFLVRKDPQLGRLLVFSGVFFTDIDFDQDSSEWHSWQHAGRSELDSRPVSKICRRILEEAHRLVDSTPSARWYKSVTSRPDPSQVDRIVNVLRPDFEYPIVERVQAETAEKELLRFTQEQFGAIDILELNPRVLFVGPAGTGKTFLALEAARRACLSGMSVLMTCFNRLLGQWLGENCQIPFKEPAAHSYVGTYHSLLLRLSGLQIPATGGSQFWTDTLPDAVVNRALNGDIATPMFSLLCIDEAQDLTRPKYLDVMDLLLDGGLANGRWAMFGDFENQAIYSSIDNGRKDVLAAVRGRLPGHFALPLRTNCRNTPQIAAGIELASGLSPGYARVLNSANGPDVDVRFTGSREDRVVTLRKTLCRLLEQHGPQEIVVLSTREDDSSTAHALASASREVGLGALRSGRSVHGNVGFTTIHAFKGLEASAVVITDVCDLKSPEARALLYVGMSRARVQLSLHLTESCRPDWISLVREGLKVTARERSI